MRACLGQNNNNVNYITIQHVNMFLISSSLSITILRFCRSWTILTGPWNIWNWQFEIVAPGKRPCSFTVLLVSCWFTARAFDVEFTKLLLVLGWVSSWKTGISMASELCGVIMNLIWLFREVSGCKVWARLNILKARFPLGDFFRAKRLFPLSASLTRQQMRCRQRKKSPSGKRALRTFLVDARRSLFYTLEDFLFSYDHSAVLRNSLGYLHLTGGKYKSFERNDSSTFFQEAIYQRFWLHLPWTCRFDSSRGVPSCIPNCIFRSPFVVDCEKKRCFGFIHFGWTMAQEQLVVFNGTSVCACGVNLWAKLSLVAFFLSFFLFRKPYKHFATIRSILL